MGGDTGLDNTLPITPAEQSPTIFQLATPQYPQPLYSHLVPTTLAKESPIPFQPASPPSFPARQPHAQDNTTTTAAHACPYATLTQHFMH